MPLIEKRGGFEIRINKKDHLPQHVHVIKRNHADLRVYLSGKRSPELKYGKLTDSEKRAAVDIVKNRVKFYRKRWREIGPKP